MWKICDCHAIQSAVGCMVNGFVESMCADPDRAPAQVELAYINRIECGIPGCLAFGKDIFLCDWVIFKRKGCHIGLAVGHIPDQVIPSSTIICHKEHIFP